MSEPKKPLPSNSSRTVVIIAVAVLIIVAIAGIVLAGRSAPAPDVAVATASAAPAASGSTPQGSASPTDPLPKEVVFEAGSDKLPAGSNEPLARFAEAARGSASAVRLSARYLTGANKARDFELAKARTSAIRHSLQSNGVTGGKMQVELIEMPEGGLTADAGNRVDLTLR